MSKARDFSNYNSVIVAAVLREKPDASIIATGAIQYRESAKSLRAYTDILSVFQDNGSHEETIQKAVRSVQNPDFFLQEADNQLHLLVDISEGSQRVVELLWNLDGIHTQAITLTGDRTGTHSNGIYATPAKEVISALIESFTGARFQLAAGIPLAETLETSLSELTVRGAEEALAPAIAVGLIAWAAEADSYDRSYSETVETDWSNVGLRE